MGPLDRDERVRAAAKQGGETGSEGGIPNPPIKPEEGSIPIMNLVFRPQLEVPFYFLDRIPKL
jgi:hypothetical protein